MTRINKHSESGLLAWAILLVLSLIWGSSFILIKKSLVAFTALEVGTARISIAFLAFSPMLLSRLKNLKTKDFLYIAIVGICGSLIPAILYAIAQKEVPSAVAGLLNGLTPIFAFILALIFFGRHYKGRHLIGILLGFGGMSLIFFTQVEEEGFPISYGLAIVMATLCYGISANTVGRFLKSVHPLDISVISFGIIGPWALFYLLGYSEFFTHALDHPQGTTSLWALIILAIIGTFGANIIFFKLVQLTDAVFASTVSFITPLVATLWGILDGEVLSTYFFVAMATISAGIYFIKKPS